MVIGVRNDALLVQKHQDAGVILVDETLVSVNLGGETLGGETLKN